MTKKYVGPGTANIQNTNIWTAKAKSSSADLVIYFSYISFKGHEDPWYTSKLMFCLNK